MATQTTDRPKVKDKVEKYTESLKVKLTADELAERSDQMSNLIAQAQEKEAEMKAAAAHAKSVIAEIKSEIHRLANEVRTRSTYRLIECERRWQYEQGQMREMRMDTFEIIGGRRLTERELQPEFPFPDEPGATATYSGPAMERDESWRVVPIVDALGKGLGKKAYDAFEKKGIATLGDFTDFQAKHGEWWAKELHGVGPETVTKICDAADAFWAARPSTRVVTAPPEPQDDDHGEPEDA